MNRRLTALFAAFEALLVVSIGIAIPLVPLTLIWGIHFGFAIDWAVFWRAAVDSWLIGHGVDVTTVLDPTTAASLGVPGAGGPVTLTIAALGFALLTVLLGVRAGRRVAETQHRGLGELISVTTFAAASLAVTMSALHPLARPSISEGTALPTLVFAVGLVIGARSTHNSLDVSGSSVRDWVADWPPRVRAAVGVALRGGAAAAAAVLALAALVSTVLIIGHYARIISLYESLHTEVLGGVAVTLGQLAFVPNVVIWTASWLIGPGFALGSGSTVSPIATQLGPIPAIPILGALPAGQSAFGFLGLLVPVVAGFLIGAILGPRLKRHGTAAMLLAGLGVGLVGGSILGLLAWFSGGAAGPGRLEVVGPNPWAVGGWAALELGLAATIGILGALRGSATGRVSSPR